MSSRPQPENPFSVHGETAIVTGGATGLGFGVATALVHAGARVVLVGRREAALQEAAAALGRETIYEVQDITEPGSAPGLNLRVEERAGPVSVLINNAGNHVKKPAQETTREDFLAILDTHVLAAFELTKAAVGGMVERQHGSIIFMASMTSIIGQPKVVLGDFNEWMKGLATSMLTERLQSIDLRSHLRRRRTYPGILPVLHLDHIYYDGRVEVAKLELPRTRLSLMASDHLPLVADLKIQFR
jgi:NAD(P)-dependent dehydrogenase (short-subunit alcohol dehydrogenase family)